MSKIFKPRRFLRSSAKTSSGSKRTTVLAAGEMAVVGETAIGGGSRADLYLGDGSTQLINLKPAIYGDTSEEDITVTADSSTTTSAALGNVVTGKTLGALIGSLKQAISLNASAISTLNDDKLDKTAKAASATYSDTATYANSAGGVAWGNVSGKPSTYTAGSGTATYATNSGTAAYSTDTLQARRNIYLNSGTLLAKLNELANYDCISLICTGSVSDAPSSDGEWTIIAFGASVRKNVFAIRYNGQEEKLSNIYSRMWFNGNWNDGGWQALYPRFSLSGTTLTITTE